MTILDFYKQRSNEIIIILIEQFNLGALELFAGVTLAQENANWKIISWMLLDSIISSGLHKALGDGFNRWKNCWFTITFTVCKFYTRKLYWLYILFWLSRMQLTGCVCSSNWISVSVLCKMNNRILNCTLFVNQSLPEYFPDLYLLILKSGK